MSWHWLLKTEHLDVSFADRSIRPLFPVGYFYDTQVSHSPSPLEWKKITCDVETTLGKAIMLA